MNIQIRYCSMTDEIFAVVAKSKNDYKCIFFDTYQTEYLTKDFISRRTRNVTKAKAMALCALLNADMHIEAQLVSDIRRVKEETEV